MLLTIPSRLLDCNKTQGISRDTLYVTLVIMFSFRNIFKIISALAVLVLVFCVSEFVLRTVVGIEPSTGRMVTYQFDDTLGWTTRSDYKYYRSSLYYGQFNYYNPQGFPTDAEHWHQNASTTAPSIAILGSSFAESYYVPYEESFPYLIEQQSKKQVLNLGVSGYAPDQYLLRARVELPKYHVKDIVAIFFPINDLPGIYSDSYQSFTKPYFTDSLDTPVNMPLTPPEPEIAQTGLVARIRNTAIYTLLRPIVRKAIEINLAVSTKQPQGFDAIQMKKAFTIFAKLKTEHPDAHLLIYMIPFYREVGNTELYHSNLKLYQDTCTAYGLTCASMDPIIATHPNMGDIFIEGDGHVTAYGAKLVADQLVELLRDKP
jgi:hypothetical protein